MSRGRPQSAGIKKFHEEKQFLFLHIKIPLISRKEKSNCATVATHRHNEEATIGMEIHHTDAYNVFLLKISNHSFHYLPGWPGMKWKKL